MIKAVKIMFLIWTPIAITGCRSAKPATAHEAVADSVAVSRESFTSTDRDSLSVSEEMRIMTNDKVEFVEGGGRVYVASDGSVILSGVAGVKSSRQATLAERKESKSLSEKSRSRDSIAETHHATSKSESKGSNATPGSGWEIKVVIFVGMIVLTASLILISKLRKYSNTRDDASGGRYPH